ncbi:hypothetical protein Esti_002443 [Eimeria stiedai]
MTRQGRGPRERGPFKRCVEVAAIAAAASAACNASSCCFVCRSSNGNNGRAAATAGGATAVAATCWRCVLQGEKKRSTGQAQASPVQHTQSRARARSPLRGAAGGFPTEDTFVLLLDSLALDLVVYVRSKRHAISNGMLALSKKHERYRGPTSAQLGCIASSFFILFRGRPIPEDGDSQTSTAATAAGAAAA